MLADDFDREVADRLAIIRDYNEMSETLENKEMLLSTLLKEKEESNNKEIELRNKIELFSQKSSEEMEEWVKLCRSLKNQLAEARRNGGSGSGGNGGGSDISNSVV